MVFWYCARDFICPIIPGTHNNALTVNWGPAAANEQPGHHVLFWGQGASIVWEDNVFGFILPE